MLGELWQASAVLWYLVADQPRARDVLVRGGVGALYIVLVFCSIFFVGFNPWRAALCFGLVLVALFSVQGRPWLHGPRVPSA